MDRQPGVRPRIGVWHGLDTASRHAFPGVLTALVAVALGAPLALPGQAQLQPAWVLSSVFFWSLYRPTSMPPLLVFGIGLLLGLLADEPLGIAPLILLLAQGIASASRRTLARQGFLLVWLAFVGVAAAAVLLEWALISLLGWRVLPGWPGLFEFLVAAGFYPLLSIALTRAHRGPAAPERA